MNKKNIIIISCVALVLISLSTVTYAYFRTGIMGNIEGNTGGVNLVVNGANANASEEFNITLKRSETEEFVIPGDSGYFDLNVNATGSVGAVAFSLAIDKSNLPLNLKFYVDEDHTKEIGNQSYKISKAETMVKTVRIYWYWADIDDANDSLFIGKNITASIVVSAELAKLAFSETLIASAQNNLDANVDFSQGASSTNGQGLMMRDGTQNDEYPIVYYRGEVSNNNVIFADFCWLIVRTTETGGIKLVFNGPVVENADGTESCTNYSGVGGETANTNYTDVYAGNRETVFNTSYDSPVYVGYMYNNDVTYQFSNANDDFGGMADYEDDHANVLPLYNSLLSVGGINEYISHLNDNSVDQTTGRHTQNKYDSKVKGVVDDWYEANIKGKPEENLLEDTVWCNDRSVISETYTIENFSTNSQFYFAAYTRLYENAIKTPSLACTRDMDKFTVDSENGNGDLDYPIGLLTADEIDLAGHPYYSSQTTYLTLTTGSYEWTLSPYRFYFGDASSFYVSAGRLDYSIVHFSNGARPSVSLGLEATITEGDGSFQSPYRVG